jgi:uncharacterized membrane protein YbhN (UPF0104 family)
VLPDFLRRGSNRRVWLWASLVTALFIVWFATTVDSETLTSAIAGASPAVVLAAMALLAINGLLAVLWLVVITRRRHSLGSAFEVIGWQMLAASILPARLGDLAWIYLIHQKLKIAPGRAVFIVFYHRLLDFVVASVFFLVSILLVGTDLLGANIGLLAGSVLALLIGIVAALGPLLTLGARLLLWADETFDNRLTRILLGQILHVRVWYRHGLPKMLLWVTFAIIAARWLAILAALSLLIHAMAGPLGWIDSAFLSNVYIYLSIIPLQTFGGFGVGEAGLAWVLTLYGLGLGKASAISLLIRIVINLLHVGFWLVTIVAVTLLEWVHARREAS